MATERRFLLDRFFELLKTKPDTTFVPAPMQIAENLWIIDRRNHIGAGLTFPTRSTLIRLKNGGLFIHSPTRLDDASRKVIETAGPVIAIVVPNPVHHLSAPEYIEAFPNAKLYLAPGSAKRLPHLPPGILLSETAPDEWNGEIDQLQVGPFFGGMAEVVFFHRFSKTLVLTDAAMNLVHAHNVWQTIYWRICGYSSAFGTSRSARLSMYRDPLVATSFAKNVLELDFDRIVMCHGEVIETGGREILRTAFAGYLH